MVWTTQEGGYFRREGLDIELPYIGGGTLLIQSMLGGDVQFAYGPSVPVVNSALRGSDLVFIANTGDTLIYSVMTRPEIREAGDLKGRKIGVTRIGGSADLALEYALKRWGLQRGRDVIVLHVIRLLRAFGEGQHRLRSDKEFSMKVLSKYTKTTDPEVLAELYQIYGVRYTGQQIPYVRLEGVDEILKGIESKEARQSKPGDFVDNSALKEVEQAGFFRKLYR